MRIAGMLLAAVILFAQAVPVAAQVPSPASVWQDVGIDQRLDAQVSPDLQFVDETGKTVKLGDYFGDKPILLSLVYYQCPMLCGQVLNGVLRSSQAIRLQLGRDYHILTVSFDPREKPELAAAKKRTYAELYAREGAAEGWHFLTGTKDQIDQLAATVGFSYKFNETSGQYAHGSGIMVLTPEGRVSRYLYGIDYHPRDLELALVESSQGKIGSPVHAVLLLCYHYDPMTGKYGLAIAKLLRVTGMLTVLALGGLIFGMVRSERKKKMMNDERETMSAKEACPS